VAVARFVPADMFAAGPQHVLNGGIIATLLDCHGVCTAMAHAYGAEGRTIGSDPEIWHATTSLTVAYLRPTPLPEEVELTGRLLDRHTDPDADDRETAVECVLSCLGKERARATVRSVRVPDEWRHGRR
jgi:acyl-coenzyme A thioesterase PaaI-like protein